MPVDIGLLLPLLTSAAIKIADGTLQEVGKGLYERVVAFFQGLRGATKDNPNDAKALRYFEKL